MSVLRGVNLGGWLVLERWMSPSVFLGSEAIDEITLSKEYPKRIKRHHETFISEEDFAWIASQGLGAVRIPIGYWVLGGEPPFVGAAAQLDLAFSMAKKYNLKVIISLHGAPGSQNGKRHSGQAGQARWHRSRQAQAKTLLVIEKLAKKYGKHPCLWGIEPLNEPSSGIIKNVILKKYYKAAYKIIRQHCAAQVQFITSDSYHPEIWKKFMQASRYQGVVMDTHLYQCYSPTDRRRGIEEHLQIALKRGDDITRWQRYKPVIVGEWGLGVGGSNTFTPVQKERKREIFRQYAANQIKSYDMAAGWFFWSYKLEHNNNWNFRYLVESGIINLE